jgi:type I restriction enzyme R subunit
MKQISKGLNMNKKELSERDICTKYITPAIVKSGWNLHKQIREEVYFTKGRILINGNKISRGESKKADYILYHNSTIPIAIIEAKDNNHGISSGMQQGLEYAEILDIPFVYSSNGDGFVEHDRTGTSNLVERELALSQFPDPDELWLKYKEWKHISDPEEEILNQDYYTGTNANKPRYYQEIAINRTVEAIAKGKDRILLVMATGTGKTFVAAQIIYRLWKSKAKKRILFLAEFIAAL